MCLRSQLVELSRKKREWYPGATYHVMSRGNRRTALFKDQSDYIRFLECVSRTKELYDYKIHSSAMFWIGYLYRYISYTRDISTKFAINLFPYKQMNDIYYTFHTQDPEWCIASLLDISGLDENIFDNNFRLKEAIKEKGTY